MKQAAQNKPWRTSELVVMRTNAHLGAVAVAELLERTPASVRQAAHRQRISLRRKGSRAGLLLGQLRGQHLDPATRADLMRGHRAELIARRLITDDDLPLCPSCGLRVARARSGYCNCCHLKAQAAAYEELRAEDEALRAVWAARTRRKALLDALETQNGRPGRETRAAELSS